MKDLFDKSAIGGVVHIFADNGELVMIADEPQFAEFMAATMAAIKPKKVGMMNTQPAATHPHLVKLAQGGVPVYGDNGEYKADLNAEHLADFLNATGVRHNSRHFEPELAWKKSFRLDL